MSYNKLSGLPIFKQDNVHFIVDIEQLASLRYNDNVSILDDGDIYYYYVDNSKLYQFDWNTKTLTLLRTVITFFDADQKPTLYKDKRGDIYAYSKNNIEYNYLLYSDGMNIITNYQDSSLHIPYAVIYMYQDISINITNVVVYTQDVYTALKIEFFQDTYVLIPNSIIINYQDTSAILGFPYDVLQDSSCIIMTQYTIVNMQNTELFIGSSCVDDAIAFSNSTYGDSVFIVRSDGVVASTGWGSLYQLFNGKNNNNFSFQSLDQRFWNPLSFDSGYRHTLIIDKNHKLWAAGDNYYGQLGFYSSVASVQFPVKFDDSFGDCETVVCGDDYTFVVKSDGTVWATGDNYYGQLGFGDTTNRNSFTQLPDEFNNPQTIVCGDNHTFIVKSDGTVWATGHNWSGQLGLGDTTHRKLFTQLPTEFNNPQFIACGSYYTFIVKSDGTLWATGDNGYGQLGLGDTTYRSSFTQVPFTLNGLVDLKCGYGHTLLIHNIDELWVAGYNYYGQLGLGDTTNRLFFTLHYETATRIGVFSEGSYIKNASGVYSTGRNNLGQLGLGDSLNRQLFTKVPCASIESEPKQYIHDTFLEINNIRIFIQDTQIRLSNLVNYQDTSVSIPNPVVISYQDISSFLSTRYPNIQDLVVHIGFPIIVNLDTFFVSILLNGTFQDTNLKISSFFERGYNIKNNLVLEDYYDFLNSLIVASVFYILNNFIDNYEKRYVLLNKLLLNDPINLIIDLKNSLIISKKFVIESNILDKYDKSINLLNDILTNLQKDVIISNNILDKLDKVYMLINEIKDNYDMPVVLKNKLNDNIVNYLLINNNLEKYLNNQITLNNILEDVNLGVIEDNNFDIYVDG